MTCNDIRYQLHCFEVSNIIILFEYRSNISYDHFGVEFDNWKIFDAGFTNN